MTEAGTLPTVALVGFPTRLATLGWWLALGTGTTADAITDTTVEGEITTGGLARASATAAYEASYKLLLTKSWIATANHTVGKIGALDASANGTLYGVRAFASTHTILNGNSVVGTMRFTFGRG